MVLSDIRIFGYNVAVNFLSLCRINPAGRQRPPDPTMKRGNTDRNACPIVALGAQLVKYWVKKKNWTITGGNKIISDTCATLISGGAAQKYNCDRLTSSLSWNSACSKNSARVTQSPIKCIFNFFFLQFFSSTCCGFQSSVTVGSRPSRFSAWKQTGEWNNRN